VRARVAASAGLTALVAIALAGCNFITPQATLVPYESSDGVSGKVGDVDVLNAVVLSEDGASGNLLFSALNSSDDDVELAVQFESGGERVTIDLDVEAGSIGQFGFGEGGQVFLADIDTKPGGLIPIYFQYGSAQGRELLVPVLDGAQAEYSPFLPTPTPTPTPTAEPDATPTPTPTP
jgi:hypothetical protein